MGLAAGALETAGIPTVVLSCFAPITERVRPPRWVDLDLPLGYPLGRPLDPAGQRAILLSALRFVAEDVQSGTEPVRRTLPVPVADPTGDPGA